MNPANTKNALYLNALPYLNVLPLNEQRLDLWLLNSLGSEVPVQLISRFLKQESVEIAIDLAAQAQNKEDEPKRKALQQSFKAFAASGGQLTVGYPLLLLEDAALGRDIAAPLFIWELELRNADDNHEEHWILSYKKEHFFRYNDILKNYLSARFDLAWDELMGAPEKLRSKLLLSALDRLAAAIKIPQPEPPKLYSCPLNEKTAAFRNGILWAGLIGNIEPKPEDNTQLPLSLRPRSRRTWLTRAGALVLNDAQETALNDVLDGQDIVITGSGDTGKTRMVASALPAFMADHGSCLIISSEQATFNDTAFHLDSLGLRESGVWGLEDETNAVESLVQLLNQLPERVKKLPKFDEKRYNLLLQQFLQLRNQLSARWEAMQKPLLDNTDWTNIVGSFMRNHRVDGKQFLSRILDTSDFEWTSEEYSRLAKYLEENELLFNAVRNLQHPLGGLQDYIFETREEEAATEWVSGQVRNFTRMLRDVYRRYTTFIDEYADDLRFHYENHIKELKQRIADILRDLKVYQDVYGNSFDFVDGFTTTRLRILSVFSKKSQQILAAKEQIFKAFDELKELYDSKRYFDHNLPVIRKYLNLSDIQKDLEAFEQAASEWVVRIPKIVRQKVRELTLKLPLKPTQKRRFEEIEHQVESFFEQLQASAVFKPFDKLKSQKATEREAQLRELLEQLTAIESELPNFPAFYRWRRHWLSMPESGRKVIAALVAVRPVSWKTAFNSWYLYHFLDKNYSIQLPDRDFPLDTYLKTQGELRELLAKNALLALREQQAEQLRLLRKEKNFQPAQARAKFQAMKLNEVVDDLTLEVISNLLPVIMTNPILADRLFEYKVPLFDVVVIEDAHSLDPQLGRRLAKLGAQRIISGRPEYSEGSFLQAVSNSGTYKRHHFKLKYSKEGKLLNHFPFVNSDPNKTNFRTELFAYLSDYLKAERLELGTILDGDLEVDLLIKPLRSGSAAIALVIDGWLKNVGKYDVETALAKSKKLTALGYVVYPIWSLQWWRSPEAAAEELVAFVLNWDKN